MIRVLLYIVCFLAFCVVAGERSVTFKRFDSCYGPVPKVYAKRSLDHYWEKICSASQAIDKRTMSRAEFFKWFSAFERQYFDGLPEITRTIMDMSARPYLRRHYALGVLVDVER